MPPPLLVLLLAALPASAQRVVTPVSTGRATAPSGMVLPWTRAGAVPSFSAAPTLSLGLTPSVISPAAPAIRLDAPGVAPSAVPSVVAAPAVAAPGLAAPAALPGGMAGATLKAAAINAGVRQALENAGPIEKASEGGASALGSEVFRKLTGDDTVVAPAGDQAAGAAKTTPSQRKMLMALDQIASAYLEYYAPLDWKTSRFGVDVRQGYLKVREAVLARPGMKDKEFQVMLADFVSSLRDYHAGIQFYSTERAGLPFSVMGAGGKYFVVRIDRSKASEAEFPYAVGDEIVEFNGAPVADAVRALMPAAPNSPKTDSRMAEMRLTSRNAQTGSAVPQGTVSLKIRTADGALHDAALPWDYKPEVVPQDVPVRDGLQPESVVLNDFSVDLSKVKAPRTGLRGLLDRLIGMFSHPDAKVFKDAAARDAENRFRIGSRRSYAPQLGKLLWEIPEESPIYAAVYADETGRKIGYLRIPDYMGEEAHLQIIAQVLMQFQKATDGLVLDQVNNPGGNMFYMHAILSMLTDKPMAVPKHRVVINESDAFMAAQLIEQASAPGGAEELADELSDMESAGLMMMMGGRGGSPVLEYARFILSELKAGRRFTSPTHLFGMTRVEPHPLVRYTKPIVALVNELDFSAGDFLPAILQDNKRAVILGARTAGAGGGVRSVEILNQLGIAGFSYTWTIAERANGQPIENLGVTPDAPYDMTENDMRHGFADYKDAILDALRRMLPPKAAAADGPSLAEDRAPAGGGFDEDGIY